jgi:hypothetical protein
MFDYFCSVQLLLCFQLETWLYRCCYTFDAGLVIESHIATGGSISPFLREKLLFIISGSRVPYASFVALAWSYGGTVQSLAVNCGVAVQVENRRGFDNLSQAHRRIVAKACTVPLDVPVGNGSLRTDRASIQDVGATFFYLLELQHFMSELFLSFLPARRDGDFCCLL